MKKGLADSESHPENGMTESDMKACADVANSLGEVIIFRSTGPWAKRWLADGFPSKNFHVKGKSSNWGPQAGFVPFDGIYSKVGSDPGKAAKGTQANKDGLAHSEFAVVSQLVLTAKQIDTQLTRKAEGRYALESRLILPNGSMILRALRHGDGKPFAFFAQNQGSDRYPIFAFHTALGRLDPGTLAREFPTGAQSSPLMVMGSAEVGAEGRAMTGDYDLLAVCPPIRDRFAQSRERIRKDAIHLQSARTEQWARGQVYEAGVGMDNVLDGRLHTGSDHRAAHLKYKAGTSDRINKYGNGSTWASQQAGAAPNTAKTTWSVPALAEHNDLGNVTPRILRAITMLNTAMGAVGDKGWQRRVHHNAESHRYIDFGALSRKEMDGGEGFPFAVFMPTSLTSHPAMAAYADTILTLENMGEFTEFCKAMDKAEYWVPTNFNWGMKSTRVSAIVDKFNQKGGLFGQHRF